MVNRVAVIFCVYLCAVHQVYSDILTSINTEAGVLTLLEIRKQFYIADFDDDNFLTYDNCQKYIQLDDLNGDGEITHQEVKSNPDTPRFPIEVFQSWDSNNDDVLNDKDIRLLFESLPGTGNKVDLQEFLTMYSSRMNETTGPVMKIQSFVQAERDFLIIDENDDNILSREEFQVEFRLADKNKNENLEESEVRNMFPMRSTPPETICPNISVSCSVDDVMALFDAADKNQDSQLSVDEYIQHFGNLIQN
ncbi:hypothetical protein LOTGIDRAFT_228146 [Lottia gigantea]|uniref:EF-hand domain-containing protein n=1 Tax=Lottia gigantea TaxID=225164 RepID=V4BCZ5_LOTGI|nr:hypothetical protein LOTGIDRAFT_228146 [Lottia gigantea]ESP05666.1 hypothetical protein LOTGIDRAFT_228146 [Lottia gigantea]